MIVQSREKKDRRWFSLIYISSTNSVCIHAIEKHKQHAFFFSVYLLRNFRIIVNQPANKYMGEKNTTQLHS